MTGNLSLSPSGTILPALMKQAGIEGKAHTFFTSLADQIWEARKPKQPAPIKLASAELPQPTDSFEADWSQYLKDLEGHWKKHSAGITASSYRVDSDIPAEALQNIHFSRFCYALAAGCMGQHQLCINPDAASSTENIILQSARQYCSPLQIDMNVQNDELEIYLSDGKFRVRQDILRSLNAEFQELQDASNLAAFQNEIQNEQSLLLIMIVKAAGLETQLLNPRCRRFSSIMKVTADRTELVKKLCGLYDAVCDLNQQAGWMSVDPV